MTTVAIIYQSQSIPGPLYRYCEAKSQMKKSICPSWTLWVDRGSGSAARMTRVLFLIGQCRNFVSKVFFTHRRAWLDIETVYIVFQWETSSRCQIFPDHSSAITLSPVALRQWKGQTHIGLDLPNTLTHAKGYHEVHICRIPESLVAVLWDFKRQERSWTKMYKVSSSHSGNEVTLQLIS